MKKLIFAILSVTLLLSACGGSSGAQDEVADLFIEIAGEQGLELDEDCVRDTTAKLSDDDAQKLVDAGIDGDPDITAEGDAVGEEVFNSCVGVASYINLVVDSMTQADPAIDADCLRGSFEGLTVQEVDEKLFDAAFECMSDG